jgi:hypothetical protein
MSTRPRRDLAPVTRLEVLTEPLLPMLWLSETDASVRLSEFAHPVKDHPSAGSRHTSVAATERHNARSCFAFGMYAHGVILCRHGRDYTFGQNIGTGGPALSLSWRALSASHLAVSLPIGKDGDATGGRPRRQPAKRLQAPQSPAPRRSGYAQEARHQQHLFNCGPTHLHALRPGVSKCDSQNQRGPGPA